MFWILRRTFSNNSGNSSCSSSNATNRSAKTEARRPPRKYYGRLSVEADDEYLHQRQEDSNNNNDSGRSTTNNNECVHQCQCQLTGVLQEHRAEDEGKEQQKAHHLAVIRGEIAANPPPTSVTLKHSGQESLDNQKPSSSWHVRKKGIMAEKEDENYDSDLELEERLNKNFLRNRRLTEDMVRIQAMAMSDEDDDDLDDEDDEDDYDEALTCNVCDRAFNCRKQLASHQQKKRHFGCSACDSLFPTLMILEHHKEEFEHWTATEELQRRGFGGGKGGGGDSGLGSGGVSGDPFCDSDYETSEAESEELERLL